MPISGPAWPEEIFTLAWPQILSIVEKHPQKEAVVAPSARLTYEAMAKDVYRTQRTLKAAGLAAGDRLAVMLGNDWPYLALYLASLASGIIFVPLNTKLARPEVAEILDHAEPQLVISDDALSAQIPEPFAEALVVLSQWQRRWHNASDSPVAPHPVQTDDVALILYTSGTTGRSKGVMLTHGNIAAQFYQSASALIGIREPDRVVSLYPLFHSAQHVFLQPPLTVGATTIIDDFSPRRVHDLIHRERVSVFFGVPAMYHILLQDPEFRSESFPDIRILTYGASITPVETIQTLKRRFPDAGIKNLYGQTENSPAVSGLDDRYALTKLGSVGLPVPGMTLAIVDEHDQEVAPGVVGEVVTRGVNLMKGYYKNPEATRQVLDNGWYHTGDLGYMDDEGFLYVIDRKKDMIIRGGQNVYPAEVENVLYAHPDVVECAVIGVPHKIYGEEVAAVVVKKPDSHLSSDDLAWFVKDRIAAYKVPVRYYFVDELPHNASGKILKRELRELAHQGVL
ncbi:class I adenylate-forming enzyme family protein [Sulfobacillus harzensis]|uniref:Long-chain fatty acid--CoA ligase n=1 Tax=Sulfobacillus harzensis TaxID=2729629 RepID=A0A7Y0Q139_9FIRM|nr:AMP-binding protein [Sulfobacillus harzensis]NMP21062.1 long-chain fatty acid--CoA ligase [Sulfobacillus harzensis]